MKREKSFKSDFLNQNIYIYTNWGSQAIKHMYSRLASNYEST